MPFEAVVGGNQGHDGLIDLGETLLDLREAFGILPLEQLPGQVIHTVSGGCPVLHQGDAGHV